MPFLNAYAATAAGIFFSRICKEAHDMQGCKPHGNEYP